MSLETQTYTNDSETFQQTDQAALEWDHIRHIEESFDPANFDPSKYGIPVAAYNALPESSQRAVGTNVLVEDWHAQGEALAKHGITKEEWDMLPFDKKKQYKPTTEELADQTGHSR